MAEARADAVVRAPYWAVAVARGVLALVPGAVITFVQDHSAGFGLLVFGVWAVVSGLIVGALSLRLVTDRVIRALFAVNAVVTVAAGILALALPASLGLLVVLGLVWFALTGIVELIAGLRARGRGAVSRDWIAAGAATALAAVALLVFPFDAVSIVGLFGVYLVIIGVLLVIGGLSLKWSQAPKAAVVPGTEQS